MNNALAILKNNDGSVLAAVILILALLTLIAFASIDRSNTEVITAGNEIVFKQNIFNAESAVVENVHRINDSGSDQIRNSASFQWLNDPVDLPDAGDIQDTINWTGTNSQADISGDARFLTVTEGVTQGSSLDLSRPQIRAFSIYGQCRKSSGLSTVRVGYRKAF
jgi:Tfp pilus assembly protein PilX